MFATTHGTAFLQIRVYAEAPHCSAKLSIASSPEDSAARAQLLHRMQDTRIWRELSPNGKDGITVPLHTVRVEVLRTEFSHGSLETTDRRFSSHCIDGRRSGKFCCWVSVW